ncbi:MAG: cob(I)yrinic acid a,c-diamide adenosyltransferase [Bacteroidaceae bacterium]|nr:cob(I)yrinic acid a,c-diamide adenosyltransferase [Bacteroidaceae bacterium]
MKIYTRTGDHGQTSLVGGQRVSKTSARIESYGTVDELNAHIGQLIADNINQHDRDILTDIQNQLFVLGGYLATDNTARDVRPCNILKPQAVTALEQEIDAINATLPPFRHFILPGGTRAAALSHVCRTVCRRAERRILALRDQGADVDDTVIAYVNRLSDYLFVLSRKLNIDENKEEKIWQRN